MRRRLLSTALALGMLLPSFVTAESGALTGTGTLLPEDDSALWQAREQELEGFGIAASTYLATETALITQASQRMQKLNDHRRDCKDSIRKANRDTKFTVTEQCYRTDLTLIRDIIQKQENFLRDVPGVSENTRAEALAAHASLLDAIATILQAMDAKVYVQESDLLDAKKNLYEKYRAPYERALRFVRIERTRMWTLRLLVATHALLSQTENTPEFLQEIPTVIACQEGVLSDLESILSDRSAETSELFRQAQSTLKSCGELLRNAASLNTKIDQ